MKKLIPANFYWLFMVLIIISCGRNKDNSVNVEVTTQDSLIANGVDSIKIDIKVTDANGNALDDRRIFTGLATGEDMDRIDGASAYATPKGNGIYEAYLKAITAGNGLVLVEDEKTGTAVSATIHVVAGKPVRVNAFSKDPVITKNVQKAKITAVVQDQMQNRLSPQKADVRFTSDFGSLSEVSVDSSGRFSVVLKTNKVGRAVVLATDQMSGLSDTIIVNFPLVTLTAPSAVHITDQPDEDRTFNVPLKMFIEPGAELFSYSFKLEFNELVKYVSVDDGNPDDAFDAPHIEILSDNTIRISQEITNPSDQPQGEFFPAEFVFECTGEGESVIQVNDMQFEGTIDGRFHDEDPPRVVCPNKRVRELCLNVIFVKGADGTGGTATTEDDVKGYIEEMQKEFDEACCKIRINSNFVEIRDDEFKESVSRARGTVVGGTYTFRLPDDLLELLRKPARDNDCLNIYLLKDIEHISYGQAILDKGRKPNGDEEEVDIEASSDPGTELDDARNVRGVLIKDNANKSKQQHTFIHEVLHLLSGLEHNNRTDMPEDNDENNVMQGCGEGSEIVSEQCEQIEENLGGFLE